MIKKAIIPAAGIGTRFLPYTKVYPKEMLPLIDEPSLTYLLDELIKSGIEEVFVIINRDKESIKTFYESNHKLEEHLKKINNPKYIEKIKTPNIKINYVYQDEQKGLGHAVLQVKEYIDDDYFVCLLGDDIYDQDLGAVTKQLIDAQRKKNAPIVGVQQIEADNLHKYGVCITEENTSDMKRIIQMIEKPQIKVDSNLAALGRYVLPKEIFGYIEQTSADAKGEIQLTDAIDMMIKDRDVYTFEIKNKRFDIGYAFGYLEAVLHFSLKREDTKEEMKKLIIKTYQEMNNN